jgi:hypothetical protein
MQAAVEKGTYVRGLEVEQGEYIWKIHESLSC